MDITKEMVRQMKERETFPIKRSQELALEFDLLEILARLDEIKEMNLPGWYWKKYKSIYELLCRSHPFSLDAARGLYKMEQKFRREHLGKYKFIEKAKLKILQSEIKRRTSFKEKCKKECNILKLKKGETVSRDNKYKIGKSIGLQVGDYSRFKSNESGEYHFVSKMLAELGYHRRRKAM